MNYYSQFNEDAIVDGLFRKIGVINKYCVEIGAADGEILSNTKFFEEQGWHRILIEKDKELVDKIKKIDLTEIFCETVTQENDIDTILSRTDCPINPDLMSIDIDGQDYKIWENMTKYRPRVLIIEYKNDIHNNLESALEMAKKKNYIALAMTGVNLICTDKAIQDYQWIDGYKKNSQVLKLCDI